MVSALTIIVINTDNSSIGAHSKSLYCASCRYLHIEAFSILIYIVTHCINEETLLCGTGVRES